MLFSNFISNKKRLKLTIFTCIFFLFLLFQQNNENEKNLEPTHNKLANPSFDCAKARTNVEIIICSDIELSEYDNELASLFNNIYNSSTNKRVVKHVQQEWIKAERDRCSDVQCLKTAYRKQIIQIKSLK